SVALVVARWIHARCVRAQPCIGSGAMAIARPFWSRVQLCAHPALGFCSALWWHTTPVCSFALGRSHSSSSLASAHLTKRCSQPLTGVNNLHITASTLKFAAQLGSVSGG